MELSRFDYESDCIDNDNAIAAIDFSFLDDDDDLTKDITKSCNIDEASITSQQTSATSVDDGTFAYTQLCYDRIVPSSRYTSSPTTALDMLEYDTHKVSMNCLWKETNQQVGGKASMIFYPVHDQSYNDDSKWCDEATARIMRSVEVHGKLLMFLRDFANQRIVPVKYGKYHRCCSKRSCSTTAVHPNGWVTQSQLLNHIPKLHRIMQKTVLYGEKGFVPYSECSDMNRGNSKAPSILAGQCKITSHHIQSILQNVSGVRTMTTKYGHYYSLDYEWLWSHFYVAAESDSLRGNLVLLLVEYRLLHLLDASPTGRYYTNEICRIYEVVFLEALLFKPLGCNNLIDLIAEMPTITRAYDDNNIGPNGNRWYLQRSMNE